MPVVERAIIMAAGKGERLQPLTSKTPKPLIKVNGKRMIDTVVDALLENGIREIYVVVGHLAEQFEQWVKKYPEVQLIENPYYSSCNNISSLYVARDHLDNCFILDGDQIIFNNNILDPNYIQSGYNSVYCSHQTEEWLMNVEDGIVHGCSRNGGSNGWQLYSISRWSSSDSRKLKNYVVQEFESGNTQLFWDDVPMFAYFDQFDLGIYEMKESDIIEIDTLDELIDIDSSYSYLK